MAKNVSPARDPALTELPGPAAELIIELEAAQPGESGEDTAAAVLTVYIDLSLTAVAIAGDGNRVPRGSSYYRPRPPP
jgi:hypothetical protein